MAPFTTRPFPNCRELIIDANRLSYAQRAIVAFLKVDVTRARKLIRKLKQTRPTDISLFSFLLYAIGRAVAADPSVQAYRNLLGRFVVYKDVDIVVPIEPDNNENGLPRLYIVRKANGKSPLQLRKELDDAEKGNLPDRLKELNVQVKLFLLLPRCIRLLLCRLIRRMPAFFIKTMGSIRVTPAGMPGSSLAWGINAPVYTTDIVIGGIRKELKMVDNKFENRDILHITVSMDHDLVDGASGARFSQRLTEMIESAGLLRELVDATVAPDMAMLETKSIYRSRS